MEYELHVQRAENAYKAFLILKKEGLIQDAISSRHYAIIHLCYAIKKWDRDSEDSLRFNCPHLENERAARSS
ncbi:MAG: hypothetical protein QW421_02875 [Archaeoglobaceae archaeon]